MLLLMYSAYCFIAQITTGNLFLNYLAFEREKKRMALDHCVEMLHAGTKCLKPFHFVEVGT